MAKKISQLTQATQVKSDDVTVIVQDGETKKLPLNMMVTKQDIENKKVAGLAKLDEIEATYENDTYTPTITVKNKSSVKVGEGDGVDYSANVMDGHAKSAILKGQTLVNYATGMEFALSNGADYCIGILKNSEMTSNKTITIVNNNSYDVRGVVTNLNGGWIRNINVSAKSYTTSTLTSSEKLLRVDSLPNSGILLNDYVNSRFIIYDGDFKDVPYFTGMQSVKMPVLTTTGKNLFDGKWIKGKMITEDGSIISDNGSQYSESFIRVSKGKYISSNNGTNRNVNIFKYDFDGNFIGRLGTTGSTFTVDGDCLIRFSLGVNNTDYFQFEQGTVATPYEPFKSNILSTSEDVELRGVGDVQDTLDLMTGEVTERIGEIVLDGSEDGWTMSNTMIEEGFVRFYGNPINGMKTNSYLICDKLPQSIKAYGNGDAFECVAGRNNNARINVKLKLETLGLVDNTVSNNSIAIFKSWLKNNNLKIKFELATESIKTVDLIPSGTHPSTIPYCWKDGHIQLSSSGLLPSLEYSVVTSRAGQISQNAAMIVKNDKRIFDLEILLAGGLVNTTYQALTLQNQVETGLSKVSLSSEKEPDYLLYHMIMKLIEEKAYKLDDLTEKVSVFYLYEKLSDEQFETIYSELYPFVEEEYIESPEDGEIIEEPIVDEVLEEVENEVVM